MKTAMVELNYTQKDGVLIPNLQVSNNSESDQPLGKYGRMAMDYLKENHPQRFMTLKMDGTLMEKMHEVHAQAIQNIEAITQQMLTADPMPQTEDTLERTRHLNCLRLSAEEIVMNEVVLKPR